MSSTPLALRSAAVALLLICSTSAHAVLIQMLPINVGGVNYVATFHDFSTDRSFNSLWDSVTADDNFSNDGVAPFNRLPTFWSDPTGAAEARDAIIAGLGSTDHVDESFGISDRFVLPSAGSNISTVTLFYDSATPLNVETAASTEFNRSSAWHQSYAWVTFETAPVPTPATAMLMVVGLLAGGLATRRTRRSAI